MGQRDIRVDDYIANAAPFAQPVLVHLRDIVHAACPQAEETIKWGAPSFTYRGRILCSMAAFKQHAAFGFWHGAQVTGGTSREAAMGQFGRITGIKDLPGKREMSGYVREAMKLIDAGATRPATRSAQPKPEIPVPGDFAAALDRNATARATFDGFAPSHRREYLEWITEARRSDTRERRIAQALEWLAEGKPRNWKYMKR